jgi:hypothetical protein
MEFDELIALLRNPGDDGPPESIYDDLSSSYALAVDGGAASVAAVQSQLDDAVSEIARLKAMNFDLLTAVAVDDSADGGEPDPTEPPGDVSIDSLFDKD